MERKKRKKLASQDIDLSKPMDLTIIGKEEDPCFGKLHDSLDPTCKRCGDSEFCMIAMAHKLNTKRTSLEAKTSYKDLEEESLQLIMDEPRFIKEATMYVRLKAKKTGSITRKACIKKLMKKFGISEDKAKTTLKEILNNTQILKLNGKEIEYSKRGS